MKKLIYQVYLGDRSKLYDHCTNSAYEYSKRIGADYKILNVPKLRIKPNVFRTERTGKCGGWSKLGYMPIFEKENVFDYFKDYDKCCVIDSDIYIRKSAPNIFDEINDSDTVASVYESDLPFTKEYGLKIKHYSHNMLDKYNYNWETSNVFGKAFFNSGVMLYNSNKMLESLDGMNAKRFLEQPMLQDFIDGVGFLKWQTDQITLNYWFKAKGINVKKLDWKWNGMYKAIADNRISEAHFVHFFLRDKLPNQGNDIKELMELI
mgnify:CR=1 FL=1